MFEAQNRAHFRFVNAKRFKGLEQTQLDPPLSARLRKPLLTRGFLPFWRRVRRDTNRDTIQCEFPITSSALPPATGTSAGESPPISMPSWTRRASNEVCKPRICAKPNCRHHLGVALC